VKLPAPSFREALLFWIKLGFISFGGPAGQIAIMHRELVDRRKWIEESRFLHALNFCMLLPGPEATQLAAYCGWMLHGVRGALAAGILFILPAIGILWGLSWIYMAYGAVPAVAAIFHGLKAGVLAIVAVALLKVGRRALKTSLAWGLAAISFVSLFFLHLPFPLIVFGALLIGFVGGRWVPSQFGGASSDAYVRRITVENVDWRSTLRTAVIGAMVWFTPIIVVGIWLGWDSTLAQLGWFFSKAAVVTFGGAYAVLPYVGQQAVENYQWLDAGQMLDGLAFAETTPGPLIMIVQFVGFVAAWQHNGGFSQLDSATLGAMITTWVTFVPTYLFIILGAPYVEQAYNDVRLKAALSAVTAAVVGVILNLTVWFGVHVLFPDTGGVDGFILFASVTAFVAMQWGKLDMMVVILSCGLLGLGWSLL
jgi:chromate transporter